MSCPFIVSEESAEHKPSFFKILEVNCNWTTCELPNRNGRCHYATSDVPTFDLRPGRLCFWQLASSSVAVKKERPARTYPCGAWKKKRAATCYLRSLSMLLPITPPRIAPAAPPMIAPLTLFLLVAAPIAAPATAPIAASRLVCLMIRVGAGAGSR